MTRLGKTLWYAISTYFEKSSIITMIQKSLIEISTIATQLLEQTPSLDNDDIQALWNKVRKSIIYTALHEEQMKQAWIDGMHIDWGGVKNVERALRATGHEIPDLDFMERHFQAESENGLGGDYPFTYVEFKNAQRVCSIYDFFKALRNDSTIDFHIPSSSSFFVERDYNELWAVSEILNVTRLALERDLVRFKKILSR